MNDDDAADDDNDDYELRLETSRGIRKCGLLRFCSLFLRIRKISLWLAPHVA